MANLTSLKVNTNETGRGGITPQKARETMKIWVVWVDGVRDFASGKWYEANEWYQVIRCALGEDRVKLTSETVWR